jgi:hypothetical protein
MVVAGGALIALSTGFTIERIAGLALVLLAIPVSGRRLPSHRQERVVENAKSPGSSDLAISIIAHAQLVAGGVYLFYDASHGYQLPLVPQTFAITAVIYIAYLGYAAFRRAGTANKRGRQRRDF